MNENHHHVDYYDWKKNHQDWSVKYMQREYQHDLNGRMIVVMLVDSHASVSNCIMLEMVDHDSM